MLTRFALAILFFSVSCFARFEDDDNEPIIESVEYWGKPLTNSWMYSALRYSEVLSESKIAFSVPYLSYCHFKFQLKDSNRKELDVKGSFARARSLISECGLIDDAVFLSDLEGEAKRQRQAEAMAYLNMSILDGKLKANRDELTVISELDQAFKIKFGAIADKVIFPQSIKAKKSNLKALLQRSSELVPENRSVLASNMNAGATRTEKDILMQRRLMKALNAGYPIILNWTVEMAALDKDGNFDAKLIKASEKQFWQSSLVIDYTAEGPDNFGYAFFKNEGSKDKSIKNLSAIRGYLTSLLIENYWYGSEVPNKDIRFDVGNVKANRLKANYLFDYFLEIQDEKATGKAVKGIKSLIFVSNF